MNSSELEQQAWERTRSRDRRFRRIVGKFTSGVVHLAVAVAIVTTGAELLRGEIPVTGLLLGMGAAIVVALEVARKRMTEGIEEIDNEISCLYEDLVAAEREIARLTTNGAKGAGR